MNVVSRRIVGRDRELDVVRDFLARVDAPAALVIEGEPGIGKTTVWQEAVGAARSGTARVLTSRPSGAETRLSFTGIGDLLEDAFDEVLAELPPPQRRALEAALLLGEEPAGRPDRRAVATAFLSAVRALAGRGPLVVAIDDVQWLDRPSAAVLDFALRRVEDEPVLLLVTRRADHPPVALEGAFADDRTSRLRLGGLSLGALHALLNARLGESLPRPLLRRIHETAGGNPYFALELAGALQRRGRRPRAGEELPVPESLEELLRERIAGLPPAAKQALPIVSALAEPTVAAVEAALPEGTSLDAAVRAGVLTIEDDRVHFDHPLLASFVYAELGPQERRSLHHRLARIDSNPEHYARHLALSTDPPAAEVARALDAAAESAASRGAPHSAAELAEQALQFTAAEQTADLARRRLAAGEHHFSAGDTARTRELLQETADSLPGGPTRARALLRLGEVLEATEGFLTATPLYREALEEAAGDASIAAAAHWRLAGSVTSLYEEVGSAAAHAHAAVELAEQSGERGLLALALAKRCVLDFYLGRDVDRESIERALTLEDEIERVGMWLEERPSTILGAMTMYVVDFDSAMARFERMHELATQSGNERALPVILFWLSRVAMRGLSFERGRDLARRGANLAQQTGQEQIRGQLLFSLASAELYLGRVDEARAAGREGLELAERLGDLDGMVNNLHSLGLTELMLENNVDADRHFSRAVEVWNALGITEPRAHSLIPDAVEAAAAVDLRRAEELLAPYERRARELGDGWPLAAAARARGHLQLARGDLDEAIALFEHAASGLEAWTQQEVGRALLSLGHAQRRARRKREARASLERAATIFEAIGAPLWLARTGRELARIGGRETAAGLTPTEQRIAELVAEGRSNKEVAAALFVKPRTVEGHLTRIYEKLGVHSRAELAHLYGTRSM